MPAKKAAPAPKSAKPAVARPATGKIAGAPKVAKAASARSATAAATATPTAKTAAIPTITMRQIAGELAEAHSMTRRQADEVMTGMVEKVVTHLKKGSKIRIGGLGILQVKKRAARMGRNPATGEQIKIKASKKVAFRPAKELKEAI